MEERSDLMTIFNNARFVLRHFVRGYYPVAPGQKSAMPVNRIFIPLANPNGEKNYIAEEGKKHILIPGFLYYTPAFLPVEFSLDEGLYFLSIQNNIEIFPGVELFSNCPSRTVIPNPPQVKELLSLLDSPREKRHLDSLRAGSSFLSIQAQLLDHYKEEDFFQPLALKEYTLLTDYLKENGNARTSVSDLANLYHESRENFTRHFSRRINMTPKALIDRFVMNRTLHLLGSGRSIKECADHLSFSNEFVFSRYFKRNMGESPSSWLKRQYIPSSGEKERKKRRKI